MLPQPSRHHVEPRLKDEREQSRGEAEGDQVLMTLLEPLNPLCPEQAPALGFSAGR